MKPALVLVSLLAAMALSAVDVANAAHAANAAVTANTARATTPANAAGVAGARRGQFDAWARADANGDGSLSRVEASRMPRLARLFDLIDADGDGVISGAEVRAWRGAARGAKRNTAPKGVDEILRIADRNGDGALSRAEVEQGMPRIARSFDRIDADRDGRLASHELGRWLSARGNARRSK